MSSFNRIEDQSFSFGGHNSVDQDTNMASPSQNSPMGGASGSSTQTKNSGSEIGSQVTNDNF